MDRLIDLLTKALDWLIDLLLWVPRKLYQLFLEGLAAFISAIPVPAFVSNAGNYLSAIDPGIAWFVNAMQLPYGLAVCLGAYVIRFLIRRIPVVG